ncbi:MAG: hypothetical protein J6386_08760 [Candidatus Synoicihabitans palmerolidicus]|nr:hypothetical protein [Candidatus Synoicihabitans palmerolidicus]
MEHILAAFFHDGAGLLAGGVQGVAGVTICSSNDAAANTSPARACSLRGVFSF